MAQFHTRPLFFRGGRVIDPTGAIDAVCDVSVVDGRVDSVGRSLRVPEGATIIDVEGFIVCPGFVDLHTHLRFPGFPEKETIESGTAAAAAGGFTTVCAMANTQPVVDSVGVFEQVQRAIRREACVHVHQLAAVTLGLHGTTLTDFGSLASAGAVAFSDDGKPVWDRGVMRRALELGRRLGIRVSVHEEDRMLVAGGTANAGATARRLGFTEWPCSGEAAMVERDLRLLEDVGGHLHVAHVSCAESVALIRDAQAQGLDVTAEVTPHHLVLTDDLLSGVPQRGLRAGDPSTKVNPPLRSTRDVEAVRQGLADGVIQAIATDHAPHTAADKALPYGEAAFGISAIETALPMAMSVVRDGVLDLTTLIRRLTVDPARVMNLAAGTLVPGATADICVFDPEALWTVHPDVLRSKGKNTPLMGVELQGRAILTAVSGAVVHDVHGLATR